MNSLQKSQLEQFDHSECLTDLSSTEQESLTGGFGLLFFQDTAIDTFGEHQTHISSADGGPSATSITRTGYSFRQTSLMFASSFFGGGSAGSRGDNQNNPLLAIFSLLQQFRFED